jgi:hypothetical protein
MARAAVGLRYVPTAKSVPTSDLCVPRLSCADGNRQHKPVPIATVSVGTLTGSYSELR